MNVRRPEWEVAPSVATKALAKKVEFAVTEDELATHKASGSSIVLAKAGNGLEVWRQAAGQPHQFRITLGSVLKPRPEKSSSLMKTSITRTGLS
jgi:hypothetical protein